MVNPPRQTYNTHTQVSIHVDSHKLWQPDRDLNIIEASVLIKVSIEIQGPKIQDKTEHLQHQFTIEAISPFMCLK